jgi:hypothetical protein
VITTADPHTLGWVSAMPWAEILAPRGLLAVITHSDTSGGRLVDPIGPLTHAAHRAGLAVLDHIILLHTPLGPAPTRPSRSLPRPDQAGGGPVHVWAYADLLLFTPPLTGPRRDGADE